MVTRWRLHGKTLATHLRFNGNTLATHWRFNGNSLAIQWQLVGDYMATHWQFIGDSMATRWRLPGNTLATHWRFNVVSLVIQWQHIGNSSAFNWQLIGNSLAIQRQHIGISMATYWLFIGYSMAIHWQLIGDELATSWHLVGTALAHGTKADWANEGGHWRANEETFIGNSLAQSSDVIWVPWLKLWTLLFATITPSFKAVHLIRADSCMLSAWAYADNKQLYGASANRCTGVWPLLCTINFSEPYVRGGQVVRTSARSPPGGCGWLLKQKYYL